MNIDYLISDFKKIREDMNYSARDIGTAASMHHDEVLRIETGRRTPNIKTFQKMLMAMGYALAVVPVGTIEDRLEPEEKEEFVEIVGRAKDFNDSKRKPNNNEQYLRLLEYVKRIKDIQGEGEA